MDKSGLIFKKDFYHLTDEVFEYLASQRSNVNGKSGWHQFLEHQILVFEHGSVVLTDCDYERRMKKAICGACTDHAHIHIVPSVSAQLVISAIEKMHVHTNKTTIESLPDLREELDPALAYILIGGSDTKSWLIFVLEYVPSQFMRKLVASSIGLTEWDWRQFPRTDLVQKSIQKIGPRLKEWLQSSF